MGSETEFVWHRTNSAEALGRFLRSRVLWAECDVRADAGGTLVLSHEPVSTGADAMDLSEWLFAISAAGRLAKLDLKEGGPVLRRALDEVRAHGIDPDRIWFNADIEVVGRPGLDEMKASCPGARVSVPLDGLRPWLMLPVPPANEVLDTLRAWGVSWLSIGAGGMGIDALVPELRGHGWPVNIWDVSDRGTFDRAMSLGPDAITADLGRIGPVL